MTWPAAARQQELSGRRRPTTTTEHGLYELDSHNSHQETLAASQSRAPHSPHY